MLLAQEGDQIASFRWPYSILPMTSLIARFYRSRPAYICFLRRSSSSSSSGRSMSAAFIPPYFISTGNRSRCRCLAPPGKPPGRPPGLDLLQDLSDLRLREKWLAHDLWPYPPGTLRQKSLLSIGSNIGRFRLHHGRVPCRKGAGKRLLVPNAQPAYNRRHERVTSGLPWWQPPWLTAWFR